MKSVRVLSILVTFSMIVAISSCKSELIESKKKYNARITPETVSLNIDSDKVAYLPVRLENRGSRLWEKVGEFPVHLSYHLLDQQGNLLKHDNSRTGLPGDLKHGESAEVKMEIDPLAPGKYLLEIDMVKENITWFADQGSPAVRIEIAAISR